MKKINRSANWYCINFIRYVDKRKLDYRTETIMCHVLDNTHTVLENSTI